MSRKVTVHNTVGAKQQSFQSSAETWGELQEEFARHNIPYQGMKAVQGNNQVTLESSQARLLDEDIIIFLVQQKVKSGMSDDAIIDWEEGLEWTDFDPASESIFEFSWKTEKDLAIARAKSIEHQISELIEYLKGKGNRELDSEVEKLQRMGEQVIKNLNLFS